MKKWLEKLVPPGMKLGGPIGVIGVLLVFSTCWSTMVFRSNHWDDVLATCYWGFENEYWLKERYEMPEFAPMLRGCFDILIFYALVMVIMVVFNYRYHYRESKSIYLMKRLPNQWELYKRCIGFPILGIICAGIVALMWIVGFYMYYDSFELPTNYTVVDWF